MKYSVNLVPRDVLLAYARRRHAHGWAYLLVVVTVATMSLWCVRVYGEAVLADTGRRVALMARRADAAQVMVEAHLDERDQAYRQASLLLEMQRPRLWPQRIGRVFTALPDGVALDRLELQPPTAARGLRSDAQDTQILRVNLHGRARDHRALQALVSVLESVPGWHEVTLTRAVREPHGDGHVIVFHIQCESREAQP